MQILKQNEIELVSGGGWDLSDIATDIGYEVGKAAGWVYTNILIGDPWSNLQLH